jgi:putative hydrolase of the HAD superfamily
LSAYEAVLFDVEGVIAHHDRAGADRRLLGVLPGVTQAQIQAVRLRPDLYALWEDYSCGLMPPVAYWGAVIEGLGREPTAALAHRVWAVQRATAWTRLDAEVLDLVRELRSTGLRIGLLSNSAPEYEPQIGAFVELFDVAHFSHRTGRRKPRRDAYVVAARALDAPLEAVVFVDDKRRNTEAAAALGITAVQFRGPRALRGALAMLGLTELATGRVGAGASP